MGFARKRVVDRARGREGATSPGTLERTALLPHLLGVVCGCLCHTGERAECGEGWPPAGGKHDSARGQHADGQSGDGHQAPGHGRGCPQERCVASLALHGHKPEALRSPGGRSLPRAFLSPRLLARDPPGRTLRQEWGTQHADEGHSLRLWGAVAGASPCGTDMSPSSPFSTPAG